MTNAADLTFNVKDVIGICFFLVTFTGAWFKIKYDKKQMQQEINDLESEVHNAEIFCRESLQKVETAFKEEIMALRNSKRNLRKELIEVITTKEDIMTKRIDKLQQEAKEDRTANNKEFKIISGKLETIAGGIGELKGMIQNRN